MGLPARCGRGPCSFVVLSAAEGLPWGLGSLPLQSESCSLSPCFHGPRDTVVGGQAGTLHGAPSPWAAA